MSLWAIGTPVSIPALPLASCRSAARAWAKACSGVTVIKAFNCLSYCSMRFRKVRVSSSLEYSLARRPAESSAMVLLCMSFITYRLSIKWALTRVAVPGTTATRQKCFLSSPTIGRRPRRFTRSLWVPDISRLPY